MRKACARVRDRASRHHPCDRLDREDAHGRVLVFESARIVRLDVQDREAAVALIQKWTSGEQVPRYVQARQVGEVRILNSRRLLLVERRPGRIRRRERDREPVELHAFASLVVAVAALAGSALRTVRVASTRSECRLKNAAAEFGCRAKGMEREVPSRSIRGRVVVSSALA